MIIWGVGEQSNIVNLSAVWISIVVVLTIGIVIFMVILGIWLYKNYCHQKIK